MTKAGKRITRSARQALDYARDGREGYEVHSPKLKIETHVSSHRRDLKFAEIVALRFAFLTEIGFSENESLPTLARYRKDALVLNIYHGRLSYEIGLEIGHGAEQFSISELLRVADPVAAEQYRNSAVTTLPALIAAVDRLAGLLRRYGERALRDDPDFFVTLRRQRTSHSSAYAIDVLAEQVRPKAETAFREKRYRDAVELYETIAPKLSLAERRKLEVARQRGRREG